LIVFAIVMVVYQQVENYILQPTIIGKPAQVSGREADQESACLGIFETLDLQGLHAGGGTRTPDTRIMMGGEEGPSEDREAALRRAEVLSVRSEVRSWTHSSTHGFLWIADRSSGGFSVSATSVTPGMAHPAGAKRSLVQIQLPRLVVSVAPSTQFSARSLVRLDFEAG
jgi:hypothetical protein